MDSPYGRRHNPDFEINPIRANVIGLRNVAPLSEVRVYQSLKDANGNYTWEKGELKEIVKPKPFIIYTTMLTRQAIAKRIGE